MATKLTAVSVTVKGKRIFRFVWAEVQPSGKVHVPQSLIDAILDEAGCHRGQTYTFG